LEQQIMATQIEIADSTMDVSDAIRTLLAVRRYQDRPVPEPVIRRVLEAGRLTASGMNAQPWHFVVVQDRDTLRQLGALVPQDRDALRQLDTRLASGSWIAEAPLAIVVAVDRTPFAVSDASRAIQSMLLTAWSDGVGGNWSGFGPLQGLEGIRDLLGIPAEVDVLAVLPLGYPADAVGRGKKRRKPLDQIAHRERWGQPFA
jgi:nitroreductase